MPERYRRVRGYPWNCDYLTEAEAAAVLERYRGTLGFEGDLACGFMYRPQPLELALVPPVTLKGPVVRVHPVPEHEVPAEVRELLAADEPQARAS